MDAQLHQVTIFSGGYDGVRIGCQLYDIAIDVDGRVETTFCYGPDLNHLKRTNRCKIYSS